MHHWKNKEVIILHSLNLIFCKQFSFFVCFKKQLKQLLWIVFNLYFFVVFESFFRLIKALLKKQSSYFSAWTFETNLMLSFCCLFGDSVNQQKASNRCLLLYLAQKFATRFCILFFKISYFCCWITTNILNTF